MDGTPRFTTTHEEADMDNTNGTITVSTADTPAATTLQVTPQYTASLNDLTTGNGTLNPGNTAHAHRHHEEKKQKHNKSSSDKLRKKTSRISHSNSNDTDLTMGKNHKSDNAAKKASKSQDTSRQMSIDTAFRATGKHSTEKTNTGTRATTAGPATNSPSNTTEEIAGTSTSTNISMEAAGSSNSTHTAVEVIDIDNLPDDNVDDLRDQLKKALTINPGHPKPGKSARMPFFGSTVNIGASTSTPAPASYSQQLTRRGPHQTAPKHSAIDATPSYAANKPATGQAEGTQTSTVNLSFQNTETNTPEFSILPQANSIWRQARACFVIHGKARTRAQKLQEWARQGLTPAWAVGTGPTPPHFLPKDATTIARLGELHRQQACNTMRLHAAGLIIDAESKEAEGQALYSTLTNIYEKDPSGLDRLTDIITRMVKKDVANTTTQLNRQEVEMRAAIQHTSDVFALRNPPPRPEVTGRRNQQRGRAQNNRSPRSPRSPSQRRPKRRRSRSTPRRRSNSRGNSGRRNNNQGQPPNQVSYNQFKQWLNTKKN